MGSAGTIRAFFALELADPARRRAADLVAALRHVPGGGDVRWVRGESLHVTLRFLGATDAARIPDLVAAVARHADGVVPFAMRLGAPELFPTRRPRVVALGVEPAGSLAALAAAVERGVSEAGFPAETRAFRPHLTLGRVRRDRRLRLDAEDLRAVTGSVTEPGDASQVTEIVLFRSDLSPRGARYTPLERVPLGTSGGPLHP